MKHLLIVALCLLACVSLWAVRRNGPQKDLSVSLHVARAKVTELVFGIVVFLAALLMAGQFFGWLLPHYSADIVSQVMFGLVVGSFVFIALVPHIEGTWRSYVHEIAAWGLVCIVPPIVILILTWSLSTVSWWFSLIMLIALFVLLILSLTRKELRRWFLYFQVSYVVLFFFCLLAVTYY